MSRIHEALLKAQREHGLQNETLDIEHLGLEAPQNRVADDSLRRGVTGAPLSDDSSVSAAYPSDPAVTARKADIGDELQSFRQTSWRPDKERLVFMKPEFSRGIEEFRRLCSRLLRERAQRYLKTILITGASPGEGKTFVTANLALAMSRHPESRVLVIDADFRRSNLHTVFGMKAVPGLSEYLAGEHDAGAIVRQTPEPQLCFVSAGKYCDTPTEVLHSPRMQQFIEHMSRIFDWIFIDSPPATAVTDSTVLSELCDAVVLVIAPGIPVNVAQRARKEMGQKVLGVVLNRAEDQAGYSSYYKYQDSKKNCPKITSAEVRK